MTHSGGKPHSNVGDRGQRYEIRATGYPKEGESVIGWAGSVEGARRMMEAILLAPGCTGAAILDRNEKPPMSEKPATTKAQMVEALRVLHASWLRYEAIGNHIASARYLASRLPSPAACAVEHGATLTMEEAGCRAIPDGATSPDCAAIYRAMERARVAAKGDDDAE